MRLHRIIINIIVIILTSGIFYVKPNTDIFSVLINDMEGKIEQCNVSAEFYSNDNDKNIYMDLLDRINFDFGKVNYEITENDRVITIDFTNEKYDGKIEFYHMQEKLMGKISIIERGSDLEYSNLEKLKVKISNALSYIDNSIEYSQCIKVKVSKGTVDEYKELILDTLSVSKSQNINTAKIYNGYSILADTGLYNKKNIFGTDIDFQCALVDYSSGCYLIMGSPEITLAY